MKTMTSSLVITLLLAAAAVSGEEAQNKTLPKPFGIGLGPTYIGGRETDEAGTKLSLDIYKQYINYKRLMMMNLAPDEQYYTRWTSANQCIGACPQYSYCQQGICVCNHVADSVVQIYGRCFGNRTASFVGDKEKYRKPTPPARPEWCFCEQKNGGKRICDNERNNPMCKPVTYPNNFDHNTQVCRRGDHAHCLGKDINMFCGDKTMWDPTDGQEKNLCQCRKDMKFDTKLMECRLFIDVDCTYVTASPDKDNSNLNKLLKGQLDEPDKEYKQEEITSAFCSLIDSVAKEYSSHIVGEFNFTFLGLGIGGLCLVALITCCTACCCCKCCAKTKEKIRRLDPRNAMRDAGMGQGAQMAALGAVAAGEYMENRNDKQDEARVAAMQGQSMGMPGGAPPGYAPVPTGYPEGPGYPQGGFQQPGYPPQQPGYPPQQPGYIPPQDGGPGLMNMAPELALAGAGAFTGNAAMTGMGVVAAAEKMGDMEDKEDRFRAAAVKGVPPPPMGYAGGAMPTYPQTQLPPATANYPRQ